MCWKYKSAMCNWFNHNDGSWRTLFVGFFVGPYSLVVIEMLMSNTWQEVQVYIDSMHMSVFLTPSISFLICQCNAAFHGHYLFNSFMFFIQHILKPRAFCCYLLCASTSLLISGSWHKLVWIQDENWWKTVNELKNQNLISRNRVWNRLRMKLQVIYVKYLENFKSLNFGWIWVVWGGSDFELIHILVRDVKLDMMKIPLQLFL